MRTFIAVYRGETVSSARLVTVSTDPGLVSEVVSRLLDARAVDSDPAVAEVENGRRQALRVIQGEAGFDRKGPR